MVIMSPDHYAFQDFSHENSGFDMNLPACFEVNDVGQNTVLGNVAAGSERLGFQIFGVPIALPQSETFIIIAIYLFIYDYYYFLLLIVYYYY